MRKHNLRLVFASVFLASAAAIGLGACISPDPVDYTPIFYGGAKKEKPPEVAIYDPELPYFFLQGADVTRNAETELNLLPKFGVSSFRTFYENRAGVECLQLGDWKGAKRHFENALRLEDEPPRIEDKVLVDLLFKQELWDYSLGGVAANEDGPIEQPKVPEESLVPVKNPDARKYSKTVRVAGFRHNLQVEELLAQGKAQDIENAIDGELRRFLRTLVKPKVQAEAK